MGPTGSPETSVLNEHTVRNNPEDGRSNWLMLFGKIVIYL
jgi:hypothetical protein